MSASTTTPSAPTCPKHRWRYVGYWVYCFARLGTRGLAMLSHSQLLQLGRWLGRLGFRLARKPARAAIHNIARCFPEHSSHWHCSTAKAYFENLGVGVMECIMALWWPDETLRPLLKINGREHIDNARAENRGVILLTAHFTPLEIICRLAGLSDIPFQGVYRELKNPWFNQWFYRVRSRNATPLIERQQPRHIVRALKQGAPLFYLPDMDLGKRFASVYAPFFGIPVATITATAKLAARTHARVLPMTYTRCPDTQSYRMDIHAPLTDFPSGDTLQDATRINACIEASIRAQPTRYFWHQKRFRRTQPMARLKKKGGETPPKCDDNVFLDGRS